MPLPQTNREIVLIRQGGEKPMFDENSRQIFKCIWEEVEHFYCIDHYPEGNGTGKTSTTTTHGLEVNNHREKFFFSAYNQPHGCDFNIFNGYYIIQRIATKCNYYGCDGEVGYRFWKVIDSRAMEFMPGCFEILLVGQNMTGREEKQLLLECQPFIHQLQGVITHDHEE
ncbi:hypothetical protein [Streptococcus hyointestinalis]|uniref:hypothetical protein n=1 Tax=Streptococcus hyointestinalis TaxID=1337 RepID=UPI0013E07C51|nr:hypothetical protein [Streptococcus hyointestinalis]